MKVKLIISIILLSAAVIAGGIIYQPQVVTCGGFDVPQSQIASTLEGLRDEGCRDVYLRYDSVSEKWLGFSAKVAPASTLAVSVIGAGSEEANGVYTFRRFYDGKVQFNKVGYPDDVFNHSIFWLVNEWQITGNQSVLYIGSGPGISPTEVKEWTIDAGDLPVPTVTE